MDPRINYLSRCFGSLLNTEEQICIKQQNLLLQFLNHPSISCIKVSYFNKEMIVLNMTDESMGEVFYLHKNNMEEITINNIVQLVNITKSPSSDTLYCLHQAIQNLYLPSVKDASLKSLLEKLKGYCQVQEKNMESEGSLKEEIDFWMKDLSEDSKTIKDHLLRFQANWEDLANTKTSLKSILEETASMLDTLWGNCFSFTEQRMVRLISCFCDDLIKKIQEDLQQDQKSILVESISMMKLWCELINNLVKQQWPFDSRKSWKGSSVNLGKVEKFCERLTEIDQIQTIFMETQKLLSSKIAIQKNEGFQFFLVFDSLSINNQSQNQFEFSKKQFYNYLSNFEKQTIEYLRIEIFDQKSSLTTLQILKEMMKWQGPLSIKSIKERFKQERESILADLIATCNKNKDTFEQRISHISLPDKFSSPLIHHLSLAKQFSGKIKRIQNSAQFLLSDLPSFASLKSLCGTIIGDIKLQEDELFESWQSQIQNRIKTKEITFDVSGKLIDLNLQDGKMTIYFSDSLFSLIREFRQLCDMGYKKQIQQNICELVSLADKYQKEARTMKNMANFYNGMDKEIIESQKPMLVAEAIDFERVAMEFKMNKNIGWSNQNELNSYTKNVEKALNSVVIETRRLKKLHQDLASQVSSMFDIDMIRQKYAWNQKYDEVKRIISQGCSGKDPKLCQQWKTHWDHQLLKVLEIQFRRNCVYPNFTREKIEVVFQNKQVMYENSIKLIKQHIQKKINDIINIPRQFSGLGTDSQLFQTIYSRNPFYLQILYSKTEQESVLLQDQLAQLKQWNALGYINSGEISKQLKSQDDWQYNLNILRQKKKDVQDIPDQIKTDFFLINLTQLKDTLEDKLKTCIDSVINSLKESIKDDVISVEKFIKDSMHEFTNLESLMKNSGNSKQTNIESILNQKEKFINLEKGKIQTLNVIKLIDEKNNMLQTMNIGKVNMTEVLEKWDIFKMHNETFQEKIQVVIENFKLLVKDSFHQMDQTLENFFEKWMALKPKSISDLSLEQAKDEYKKLSDWQIKWSELKQNLLELNKNCAVSGFGDYHNPIIIRIQHELDLVEQSWGVFKQFYTELVNIESQDWLTFRKKIPNFQDFISTWIEKVISKQDYVFAFILQVLENFQKLIPILKCCAGENFEKDHWQILFKIIDFTEGGLDKLHLSDFLNRKDLLIQDKIEKQIKELFQRATGELLVKEAINELQQWLDTYVFDLTTYESINRKTPLIKEWKDMMTKVSDNQSLVASLKDSKFALKFQPKIVQIEQIIFVLDDALHTLNVIQRKWIYLEPIFNRGALPSQQASFQKIDEEFRNILFKIEKNPLINFFAIQEGIQELLNSLLAQLEQCQKALNDYLEEKRNAFSRFYFLGDDDLLEILGQSKNPSIIQQHLKKLFMGIHQVQIDKNSLQAMISSDSELVSILSVAIVDEVELWMGKLVISMQTTLKNSLRDCLQESKLEIDKYPSQILSLSEQIRFCQDCVNAIKGKQLSTFKTQQFATLQQYTSLIKESSSLNALKFKSMVLDLIHNIEVIDQLIQNSVTKESDWFWFKQLRYDMKKDVQIIMCKASFEYSFEYQGNAPKLVHTPLTDKCYLTLTQAMFMGYGGNPYGPAGTGKTESVKALGQAFGRQTLVFNCDEGLDYKSMGRIFQGLVLCGAWGCFDEFNRLLEDQLSAISQQIQIIQSGIKEGQSTLQLLGTNIAVNKNSGIFVTLNPAGKGYGGRSKLPDNLKQLFRPIAMSVPDNELIAEVLLFSEGFKNAKQLAKKVVNFFTLSQQLLSKQQHYDWGLRPLKTILNVSGQLIQGNESLHQESVLLIKAIRINTMSKLTYEDVTRFEHLLNDVFPGVECLDIEYPDLLKAIEKVIQEFKLQKVPAQINKILQFYEATKQKIGVVLVGPSGSGKTTIWKILKRAQEIMGQQVVTYVMNPKSMPRHQLLGLMNNEIREFTDGVLTYAARQVVKQPQEVDSWIICDGDIDPEWIESLNSVLDDNHLLTLPSGERISFGSNVNFIFETSDLQFASPATVSRMGMLFLNTEDMPLQSILQNFLSGLPEKSVLHNFLPCYFQDCLDKTLSYELVVKTTRLGLIKNTLSLITSANNMAEFADGILKGFLANIQIHQRSNLMKQLLSVMGITFGEETEFEVVYGQLVKISPTYEKCANSGDLFPVINTSELKHNLSIVSKWMAQNETFIIVGPEGCGKNIIFEKALEQLRQTTKTQVVAMHCNAQTQASQIIQKLNQICLKANNSYGRILKPKNCQRLIIYLKDINLPKPDKYNTIQLIAFLQQMITHKGFYDTNLEFVQLDEKIQIVCTMNPPSTIGRHELSSRFTANARILLLQYPKIDSLKNIYSIFLKGHHQSVSAFLVDWYNQIRQQFSVDDYRHYLFTPKDLSTIIFQLNRYENPKDLDVLYYECCRAFKDRIVNSEGKARFDALINGLMVKYFDWKSKDYLFTSLTGQKLLIPIKKIDYIMIIQQAIVFFEREQKNLNLILLEETIELLQASIFFKIVDRMLSQPASNFFLAGRCGTGRRSCVSLIAHKLRYELFTPSLTKNYSLRDFKKDLKSYFEILITQNKSCILFIEDFQLIQPEFLEILNSLISSGEISSLYSMEEIEVLCNPLDELKQEYSGLTIQEAFTNRLKKQLHIILSLDHTSKQFASYCASNPALITKCTIVWLEFQTLPSQIQIINNSLLELKNILPENTIKTLALSIQKITTSLDYDTCKPIALYHNLELFKKIFNLKNGNHKSGIDHLELGIRKLNETNEKVKELSIQAETQKKQLEIKEKEANIALESMSEKMAIAQAKKNEIEVKQKHIQDEEAITISQENEVKAKLEKTQPMVDEALLQVGSINKSHLDELKNMRMPPEPCSDVLSAVLKLFGINDNSWNSMKRFLTQSGFIQQIINFDAKTIKTDTYNELNAFISKKQYSFQKETIFKVSRAAGPLAMWVVAILSFSQVLISISPLTDRLNKLQKQLLDTQKDIEQCEAVLNKINDEVAILKENFKKKTTDAEKLKAGIKKSENTLIAAQSLVSKLSGEKVRWSEQIEDINNQFKILPYDALLASSFITYLSSFPESQRDFYQLQWSQNISPNFNILKFLSSESILLEYKSQQLPSDTLSLQNSVMVFQHTTPLLIDPNNKATEWLQVNQGIDGMVQSNEKLMNSLELSVRFGKTIIIKEVDNILGVWINLIRQDKLMQAGRALIKIGDKQVEYTQGFRLYLCTRDSSIQMKGVDQGWIGVINFTVTKSGLENKLLSIIINREKPDIEEKKSKCLQDEESLKLQVAQLEKNLLDQLASSQGDILENTELIRSLNETKQKAQEIKLSLQKSLELQQDLDQQRNVYRSLANVGANLFIQISEMKKLNHMYRFSLAQFIKVFEKSLVIGGIVDKVNKKLELAQMQLQINLIDDFGISLFKQDRLLFGLYLSRGIVQISDNEWNIFLNNVANIKSVKLPEWIPEDRRNAAEILLSTIPSLQGVLSRDGWFEWIQEYECEKSIPKIDSIPLFQRFLIINTLRPDRAASALSKYICEVLSTNTVYGNPKSIRNLFEQESSGQMPILFITTQGSDPSEELEEFAKTAQASGNTFQQLSMGGNQNDVAISLLRRAAQTGDWLCLKNIHLVTSWLPELEKELKSLELHPNFRLWLTSEAHNSIPAVLLESCYKVAYEAPPGVKKNMLSIFKQWPKTFFEQGTAQRSQLLFKLSLFQSLIQERRTYIPQGWTKFYEFSSSDLRAAIQFIESSKPDLTILMGIFLNAIYGGRVDNATDMLILQTYLNELFNGNQYSTLVFPQAATEMKHYLTALNTLPETDSPSIFGLPQNIDKAIQRQIALNVVSNIKMMEKNSQTQQGDAVKIFIDNWKKNTQLIQNIPFNENPLENFVLNQFKLAQEIQKQVQESLDLISGVIKGQGLMTSLIQSEIKSIQQGQVPLKWYRMWEGPDDLITWMKGLQEKEKALTKWVQWVQTGTFMNQTLVLSELFHSEIFLNALRQKSSRSLHTSIDDLKLVLSFSESKIKNDVKFKIKGLLLQGASFNSQEETLIDPLNNAPEYSILPTAYLSWVNHTEPDIYPPQNTIDVPLYFNGDRERVITHLKLQSKGDPVKRILAGVALFLSEQN